MFIIHLATIPPREDLLNTTLISWLIQEHNEVIESIVITIPEESKFYGKYNLDTLTSYVQKIPKLNIQRLKYDYGAANKIVGAILFKKLINTKSHVIICDDDIFYNLHTLSTYLNSIKKDDNKCYTPFETYDLYDLGYNRLCGADSFLLPHVFFELEPKYSFHQFFNFCVSNCPEMFFNDDYIISTYLNKIKIPVERTSENVCYYGVVHNINQIHKDEQKQKREEKCKLFLQDIKNKRIEDMLNI